MTSPDRVICSLVILLSLVYKSTCLSCYKCNSAIDPACLDVNVHEDEMQSKRIPIVQCDSTVPPSSIAPSFLCKKIVRTIYHSHRESEVRVTRGCGWVEDERDYNRDNNSDHLGTFYHCFSDLCNSADSVDPAGMTFIFILFAMILHFLR